MSSRSFAVICFLIRKELKDSFAAIDFKESLYFLSNSIINLQLRITNKLLSRRA
jgi:hypothetical protein